RISASCTAPAASRSGKRVSSSPPARHTVRRRFRHVSGPLRSSNAPCRFGRKRYLRVERNGLRGQIRISHAKTQRRKEELKFLFAPLRLCVRNPNLARGRFLRLFFRRGFDEGGARHLITCISLDQAYALGAAARLSNVARFEADQFPLLRDDHDL